MAVYYFSSLRNIVYYCFNLIRKASKVNPSLTRGQKYLAKTGDGRIEHSAFPKVGMQGLKFRV